MTSLIVTSGEPAGIGPDICLDLAFCDYPVVVIGDIEVLSARAKALNKPVTCYPYDGASPVFLKKNHLAVYSLPTPAPVHAGVVNPLNAPYVIEMLSIATHLCLKKGFSGMVTAPVHKEVVNQAGIPFSGHTEFLQEICAVEKVVMLFTAANLRVALATTHLPLKEVSSAIQYTSLVQLIGIINKGIQEDFAIKNPKILVAGLNPHAGEGGYLGKEEQEIITPAISTLQKQGIHVQGPFSADTLFCKNADVFVAMYHDQGLPVIKTASFGKVVNVTLGLPIVRTSVDHGTALHLAGSGKAQSSSLMMAVEQALAIANNRKSLHAVA